MRCQQPIHGIVMLALGGCGLTFEPGWREQSRPPVDQPTAIEPAQNVEGAADQGSRAALDTDPSLVGWWRFNDAAADFVFAETGAVGNGYGVLRAGATRQVHGNLQSIRFDGGETAAIKFLPSAATKTLDDLSVALLVNVRSLPLAGVGAAFVYHGKYGEDEADNILYSLFLGRDGRVKSLHESGPGNWEAIAANNKTVSFRDFDFGSNLQRWIHLAMTRHSSTKTLSFFVDGALKDTASYTDPPTGGGGGNLWFGADPGSDAVMMRSIDAEISEVRIYSRQLDPAEIRQLSTTALALVPQ